MGGVCMCHYHRYMYIWSSALLNRVVSVCAIIDDTGIYCHQRQFMQTTIYADDNLCNIYCRRRQFMQATIYAVTHWPVHCRHLPEACGHVHECPFIHIIPSSPEVMVHCVPDQAKGLAMEERAMFQEGQKPRCGVSDQSCVLNNLTEKTLSILTVLRCKRAYTGNYSEYSFSCCQSQQLG